MWKLQIASMERRNTVGFCLLLAVSLEISERMICIPQYIHLYRELNLSSAYCSENLFSGVLFYFFPIPVEVYGFLLLCFPGTLASICKYHWKRQNGYSYQKCYLCYRSWKDIFLSFFIRRCLINNRRRGVGAGKDVPPVWLSSQPTDTSLVECWNIHSTNLHNEYKT